MDGTDAFGTTYRESVNGMLPSTNDCMIKEES